VVLGLLVMVRVADVDDLIPGQQERLHTPRVELRAAAADDLSREASTVNAFR